MTTPQREADEQRLQELLDHPDGTPLPTRYFSEMRELARGLLTELRRVREELLAVETFYETLRGEAQKLRSRVQALEEALDIARGGIAVTVLGGKLEYADAERILAHIAKALLAARQTGQEGTHA